MRAAFAAGGPAGRSSPWRASAASARPAARRRTRRPRPGVIALTRSAALEYGPRAPGQLRVARVHPHRRSPTSRPTHEAYRAAVDAGTPLGRAGHGRRGGRRRRCSCASRWRPYVTGHQPGGRRRQPAAQRPERPDAPRPARRCVTADRPEQRPAVRPCDLTARRPLPYDVALVTTAPRTIRPTPLDGVDTDRSPPTRSRPTGRRAAGRELPAPVARTARHDDGARSSTCSHPVERGRPGPRFLPGVLVPDRGVGGVARRPLASLDRRSAPPATRSSSTTASATSRSPSRATRTPTSRCPTPPSSRACRGWRGRSAGHPVPRSGPATSSPPITAIAAFVAVWGVSKAWRNERIARRAVLLHGAVCRRRCSCGRSTPRACSSRSAPARCGPTARTATGSRRCCLVALSTTRSVGILVAGGARPGPHDPPAAARPLVRRLRRRRPWPGSCPCCS